MDNGWSVARHTFPMRHSTSNISDASHSQPRYSTIFCRFRFFAEAPRPSILRRRTPRPSTTPESPSFKSLADAPNFSNMSDCTVNTSCTREPSVKNPDFFSSNLYTYGGYADREAYSACTQATYELPTRVPSIGQTARHSASFLVQSTC